MRQSELQRDALAAVAHSSRPALRSNGKQTTNLSLSGTTWCGKAMKEATCRRCGSLPGSQLSKNRDFTQKGMMGVIAC